MSGYIYPLYSQKGRTYNWSIASVQAATDLPCSIEDMRMHLRVDDDDATLEALIKVAADWIQRHTGFYLAQQTVREYLDDLTENSTFVLHAYPVISLTAGYYDTDNAAQTWSSDDYVERLALRPPQIYPETLPSIHTAPGSFWFEMVVGHADVSTIPETVIHALKLIAGHFYEHREATVGGTMLTDLPIGVHSCLADHIGYRN